MTDTTAHTPLDPAKVDAYIADQRSQIEAQRTVVEKLRQLVDDEERQLRVREGQLTAFREMVNRVGLADGTTR